MLPNGEETSAEPDGGAFGHAQGQQEEHVTGADALWTGSV